MDKHLNYILAKIFIFEAQQKRSFPAGGLEINPLLKLPKIIFLCWKHP